MSVSQQQPLLSTFTQRPLEIPAGLFIPASLCMRGAYVVEQVCNKALVSQPLSQSPTLLRQRAGAIKVGYLYRHHPQVVQRTDRRRIVSRLLGLCQRVLERLLSLKVILQHRMQRPQCVPGRPALWSGLSIMPLKRIPQLVAPLRPATSIAPVVH